LAFAAMAVGILSSLLVCIVGWVSAGIGVKARMRCSFL